MTVFVGPVAYTAVLGGVLVEDVYTGTVELMEGQATASVPSVGQPEGYRKAGLAYMRNCLAVEVPAKGKAVEEQDLSWVGECVLSSLALRGVRAGAMGLVGGKGYHRWA